MTLVYCNRFKCRLQYTPIVIFSRRRTTCCCLCNAGRIFADTNSYIPRFEIEMGLSKTKLGIPYMMECLKDVDLESVWSSIVLPRLGFDSYMSMDVGQPPRNTTTREQRTDIAGEVWIRHRKGSTVYLDPQQLRHRARRLASSGTCPYRVSETPHLCRRHTEGLRRRSMKMESSELQELRTTRAPHIGSACHRSADLCCIVSPTKETPYS